MKKKNAKLTLILLVALPACLLAGSRFAEPLVAAAGFFHTPGEDRYIRVEDAQGRWQEVRLEFEVTPPKDAPDDAVNLFQLRSDAEGMGLQTLLGAANYYPGDGEVHMVTARNGKRSIRQEAHKVELTEGRAHWVRYTYSAGRSARLQIWECATGVVPCQAVDDSLVDLVENRGIAEVIVPQSWFVAFALQPDLGWAYSNAFLYGEPLPAGEVFAREIPASTGRQLAALAP